ncbi:MAG: hypothetical protein Q9198_005692 [Flavoplaca austrocitrina]
MSSVGARCGGSGRMTPEPSSVGGKPSLAGGLAEALRQRQASMQGKKDDDDELPGLEGIVTHLVDEKLALQQAAELVVFILLWISPTQGAALDRTPMAKQETGGYGASNLSHRVGTIRLIKLMVSVGLVNNRKDLYVRPGNDSQGDKEEHGLPSINPPLIRCFRPCLYQNAKVIREEWERQTTRRKTLFGRL